MRHRSYIPILNHWYDMYVKNFDKKYWTPKRKVPIRQIKIDRDLCEFKNEVSKWQVLDMLVNFDIELWMPITINKDFCLLDGQHRLSVANQLGLKFIDVVIEDTDLLNSSSQESCKNLDMRF